MCICNIFLPGMGSPTHVSGVQSDCQWLLSEGAELWLGVKWFDSLHFYSMCGWNFMHIIPLQCHRFKQIIWLSRKTVLPCSPSSSPSTIVGMVPEIPLCTLRLATRPCPSPPESAGHSCYGQVSCLPLFSQPFCPTPPSASSPSLTLRSPVSVALSPAPWVLSLWGPPAPLALPALAPNCLPSCSLPSYWKKDINSPGWALANSQQPAPPGPPCAQQCSYSSLIGSFLRRPPVPLSPSPCLHCSLCP